jgi:hypothetical protein
MKPKTGSHHFSGQVNYDLHGNTAVIKPLKWDGDILRIAEVWSLAYHHWLTYENQKKVEKIAFDISSLECPLPELELFKRRISYLALNNSIVFEIKGKNQIQLYTITELLNRPPNEIIIQQFKQRSGDDTPGRTEKDLQAFVMGGTILQNTAINYKDIYRRLGIFGIDFFQLDKDYRLIREFPTGVFNVSITEKNRILPTKYIDFVAFNKFNEIAVIELKINDTKLHVISQLLDYALFALSYRRQIFNVIDHHFGGQFYPKSWVNKAIACYIVNNYFHDRFDRVARYYSPKKEVFDIKIKKIILGMTAPI